MVWQFLFFILAGLFPLLFKFVLIHIIKSLLYIFLSIAAILQGDTCNDKLSPKTETKLKKMKYANCACPDANWNRTETKLKQNLSATKCALPTYAKLQSIDTP